MKARTKRTQERSDDQLPPPGQAVKVVASACLALAAVAAGVVLWLDRDAGVSAPTALRTTAVAQGVMLAEPYPMIIEQTTRGQSRVTLLKDTGSGDATRKARSLDGEAVRVAGSRVRHGPRPLIEVFDASNIAPSESFASVVNASSTRQRMGDAVVRGELSTSESSADPAMLLAPDGTGGTRYYLLATLNGGRLDPGLLRSFRGVVEASGRLERVGDLWILRVDPAKIRPGSSIPG